MLTEVSGERFPFFQYVVLFLFEFETGRKPVTVAERITGSFSTSSLKARDLAFGNGSNIHSKNLVFDISEFEMLYEIHLVVYGNCPDDQNRGNGELKHHQYTSDKPSPASGSDISGQG